MGGEWPWTLGERLIDDSARSCAPALVASGM